MKLYKVNKGDVTLAQANEQGEYSELDNYLAVYALAETPQEALELASAYDNGLIQADTISYNGRVVSGLQKKELRTWNCF